MLRTAEIKIYREENGFTVRIFNNRGLDPAQVFVYNHQRDLLADIERFISDEQSEKDDLEQEVREEAEQRGIDIMEE